MNIRKQAILLCEKGWREIRELSITLAGKNIPTTVLVKGLIDRETKEMITKHKGIHNIFIPSRIFTPFLFIYLFFASAIFSKKGLSIYFNKEKTFGRLTVLKKLFPRIELRKVYDRK